jgi:hypothetical protein
MENVVAPVRLGGVAMLYIEASPFMETQFSSITTFVHAVVTE